MSLAPLLNAPLIIQLHVATVVPAAIIGAVILLRPKGTAAHRLLGRIWVVLMIATSLTTFFIHTIDTFYGFSPIHILSITVILGCARAVAAARRHDIRTHLKIMRAVYAGGIGLAGLFTLYPGRLMNQVVFGGASSALVWGIIVAAMAATAVYLYRLTRRDRHVVLR